MLSYLFPISLRSSQNSGADSVQTSYSSGGLVGTGGEQGRCRGEVRWEGGAGEERKEGEVVRVSTTIP